MRIYLLLIFIGFRGAVSVYGEESSGILLLKDKEIPLTIESVSEDRSSKGWSRCSVGFEYDRVPGIQATHVETIKAIDDTGKNLLKEKAEDNLSKINNESATISFEDDPDKSEFTVYLKESNRAARMIRELSGLLHVVEIDRNQPVVIKDIKTRNAYIENDELDAHDIKMAVLSRSAWEGEEGSKILMDSFLGSRQLSEISESEKGLITAPFQALSANPAIIALMVISDPHKKIVRKELFDSKKNKKVGIMHLHRDIYMAMQTENFLDGANGDRIGLDTIKFDLKTDDKAVRKVPFTLKNIPLP